MAETGATAWRWLIAGEFRAFPMRFVLPGLAIAIGVALAFAVHVINRSAAGPCAAPPVVPICRCAARAHLGLTKASIPS